MSVSALITDFYELTMMNGYFKSKNNPLVVFDMFYRTNPFNGGYVVFTGLHDLLKKIESFTFSKTDIDYLRSLNKFDEDFLDYLKSFRFKGSIYAMEEGSIVFPSEPLVRVESTLMEAQIIEGMLLNTINFQSLIATKSSRMAYAAKGAPIMEFGLRRAQGGDGALTASRAAFIGGCSATSNTLAGKVFNIPVSGTMAHSWVMSFEDELEAFRVYADLYPDNAVLLIDTYDTLGSGIENAIIIGRELKKKGKTISVRIDSGDLSYLSREIRRKLDESGLTDSKIVVSNDLTEEIVENFVNDSVPIDSYGIGTHLVTGGNQSSLNGVYKLSAKYGEDRKILPVMKISNSFEKATNPGRKQVWRFFDHEGSALGDLITLDHEKLPVGEDIVFHHPLTVADYFTLKRTRYATAVPMLTLHMENGERVKKHVRIENIQEAVKKNLSTFHSSYKRMINPHIYKVSLSRELKQLKTRLVLEAKRKQDQ
ncbi:MAG: nicotinate phosphoribosyltransferase [Sphaerochaetaceae bacterium]|nr:nicotinate phosphoribosyltransferase [Sphaerochaetaceae bacterium]